VSVWVTVLLLRRLLNENVSSPSGSIFVFFAFG